MAYRVSSAIPWTQKTVYMARTCQQNRVDFMWGHKKQFIVSNQWAGKCPDLVISCSVRVAPNPRVTAPPWSTATLTTTRAQYRVRKMDVMKGPEFKPRGHSFSTSLSPSPFVSTSCFDNHYGFIISLHNESRDGVSLKRLSLSNTNFVGRELKLRLKDLKGASKCCLNVNGHPKSWCSFRQHNITIGH